MKNFLLAIGLLATLLTNAQQRRELERNTRFDEYYSKSIRQKNIAWTCLGGGAAMIAGGALLIRSRHDALSSDNKGKTTAVNLLLITGSGLVLTSPFMFIASGRNKRIAMSLSLRNESVPTLRKTNYAYQTIPALSVKMGF